jgi:diguanylate cyclase (GGDEF)-like protein
MNPLEVPLLAVSYAAKIGVNESALDTLLKPKVSFKDQLERGTTAIRGFATFSSTPTLREDVAHLQTLIPEVEGNTVSFTAARAFMLKMSADVDNVWYRDYRRMQADVSNWQPPGTFEVHAAALRQTYEAFLSGGREVEGALYVLEGVGPPDAKQELIQAAGEFATATFEFAGNLSIEAQRAWTNLEHNRADQRFEGTIREGLSTALNGTPPPFADNTAFAGSSLVSGLLFLSHLNVLVTAASQDLHDTALAQASVATHRFMGEIFFLILLLLTSVGGVILASQVLTRPLKRLATTALLVHSGEFDVALLPETGPREVVTTTAAFNDMASTLKAVEARAVALAAEDLSNLELLSPLPGRTGRALQASIDTLAARIHERELQRKLLHETATHDPLTGLLNRAAVLDYLTNDVTRRRQAGETVAVLFVDLDGLKPLNDTYGHDLGDTAILSTGAALLEATDRCDVVGRLGGDEFLVILCHDHSGAGDTVAEHIRRSVARCSIAAHGGMIPLQASVGVALTQCDADTDPMQLVRQADEAMYGAKKAARALREQARASNN